ncbi:hypothetical protein EDB85DRAFT_1894781 [Lactarius pseudohatsudake]|nr:hypothetical protein EDB85DRAFT_1894781 [Lactarius pseudohatsudake]
MKGLKTRTGNKDKHPGRVDLGPPRRTPDQKRTDDRRIAEEKEAREDHRKVGVRQLAEVEQRDMQRVNTLMGPGPGPQAKDKGPRPRMVTLSNMAALAVTRGGTVDTGSNVDDEEESEKVKKTRIERATYRKEVEAEKKQGKSVAQPVGRNNESYLDLPTPHHAQNKRPSNEKNGISGPHTMKRVQSWMSRLQSPSQSVRIEESSASSRSYGMSVTSSEFALSSAARRIRPESSSFDDGLRYRQSSEPNEGEYCNALANLPKPSERLASTDIIKVLSNQRDSPPVSNGSFASHEATENFLSLDGVHSVDDTNMDLDPPRSSSGYYNNNEDDNTDQANYALATPEDTQHGLWVPASLMSTDTDSLTEAVAPVISKRDYTPTEMEDWPTALTAPRIVKSESHKKATNKDLPLGAAPEFRRDVIPTIWHRAAGKVCDPFNIDEHDLVKTLVVIWRHVYTAKTVVFDIPIIVSLTNQRFSEWRNSFTSAVASAMISLFSSDDHYLQYDARVGFALDMMQHYRFLFSDTFSDSHGDWTGMWRGPLFLQVFASQFNATTSRIVIPELDSETQGYEGAMALAAAALERTLTLLANGEIDIKLIIEDKEATGTKRKRKATKTAVWKVEQPNGLPQAFSDTVWGGVTREYMSILGQVPGNAMATILYDARMVAVNQKAKTPKAMAPSSANDQLFSERAALAFR